jgi:uncharacterized metal-binding protein (TIGR02443 family)
VKRRFIAGAQCPNCGEQDSLYIEDAQAMDRVACMDCDYKDERPLGSDVEVNSSDVSIVRFNPRTT